MANRVILGKRGTDYGVFVSKAGQNVLTCADKDMLFDSTKNRTGQIYGGGAGINFVDSSSDQEAYVRGTSNLFSAALINQGNLSGKKIIIDGTTVTLSSTTSYLQYTWTSVDDIKDDINAASISGITAFRSTLSSTDHRLGLRKATSDMVISYPASNSLETIVGISAGTYDYPDLASSGVNFLTASGTTKPNLGYVPLVVLAEQVGGGYEGEIESDDTFESVNRLSLWKTTSSTMHPVGGKAEPPSSVTTNGTFVGNPVFVGREYGYNENLEGEVETNMVNANFFVLRIPCAYGYMTSTYFG